jgi:hypothetical protein
VDAHHKLGILQLKAACAEAMPLLLRDQRELYCWSTCCCPAMTVAGCGKPNYDSAGMKRAL